MSEKETRAGKSVVDYYALQLVLLAMVSMLRTGIIILVPARLFVIQLNWAKQP